MSKTATFEFEGKKYEFPVTVGTEDEIGIDIKSLRGEAGLITLDPGFKNTGSCESAITFLDGEKGILRYRGYAIEDLAEKADFLEVAYLLIFGELPSKDKLDKFTTDIKEQSHVDEEMKKILDGFPKSAHPMGVLSSLTSALIAFNPSSVDVSSEEDMYKAIVKIFEKADFLEVAYLLIFGELPSKEKLDKFTTDIKEQSHVDEEMKKILDGFPKSAHPMGVLSSLTSALIAFNPSSVDVSSEEDMYKAIVKILGKFPVLAAWTLRKKNSLPLNYGDEDLGYVENLHKMMFEKPNKSYSADKAVIEALDKLLILHADHEQNCSTSTVRMVGSSHAGLFASISAGISALWGPLHGGANQAVIEMLEKIKEDGGDTHKFMQKAKDKEDPFRLMGFGHRVYKNFDPRAKIIKKSADEVLGQLGVQDPVLDIAKGLEKEALEDDYFVKRKLYPNVDFYSGIIYRALGIPVEMFTVMFALGRLPGWIAQWREMRLRKEPIGRPRQIYIGENHREFKTLGNR